MFILDSNGFPTTTAELAQAINSSLRQSISQPNPAEMAQLSGDYPDLNSVQIDVSGGTVKADHVLPDVAPVGPTEPGPTARRFSLVAQPIRVSNVAGSIDLSASAAKFSYGRNRSGQPLVMLDDAGEGRLSIRIDRPNLAAAILLAARAAGTPNGIDVQDADVSLAGIDPRTLDIDVKITAKKLVTIVLRVRGRLQIDEQLNAILTGLEAEGKGMAGAFAVGLLRPKLQKLEGRKLPMMVFSMGNVRLRDFTINADNGLEVTAWLNGEIKAHEPSA